MARAAGASILPSELRIMAAFVIGAAAATAFFFFFIADGAVECNNVLAAGCALEPTAGPIDGHEQLHSVNNTSVLRLQDELEEYEGLAEMLEKVATEDGTVIMTAANAAWTEPGSLMDVFLEGFQVGDNILHLLNHTIVIAIDSVAFDRCVAKGLHCFFLTVAAGVDMAGEKAYRSQDYLTLMWRRNKLQRRVLELGYNFLFTDLDIVWFRDIFPHISAIAHITISSDAFLGGSDDLYNHANGGLIYVKSSKKTVEFYRRWYEARMDYPGEHEQHVFDELKWRLVPEVGVRVRFLDTIHAGSMCQPRINFHTLCTVHANCRAGLAVKLLQLRSLLDGWKSYRNGTSA